MESKETSIEEFNAKGAYIVIFKEGKKALLTSPVFACSVDFVC